MRSNKRTTIKTPQGMVMTLSLVASIALAGITSCNGNRASDREIDQSAVKKDAPIAGNPAAESAVKKPDLKSLHFDSAKDPSCGMPLHAGLEDTAHYKGKLYGFCSKECKDAFLKNPEASLANLK